MPGFVNTVDIIGDDALTDSLIDRSIVEYNSDELVTIGISAFTMCNSLISVNFPTVTTVEISSFSDCNALVKADFATLTTLSGNAFMRATALTTFILRSPSVCTLSGVNVFLNGPIAKGTGYIYVPSALVDSYKAATNWSRFANQFRALEDYTVDGTTTGELDPTKI